MDLTKECFEIDVRAGQKYSNMTLNIRNTFSTDKNRHDDSESIEAVVVHGFGAYKPARLTHIDRDAARVSVSEISANSRTAAAAALLKDNVISTCDVYSGNYAHVSFVKLNNAESGE